MKKNCRIVLVLIAVATLFGCKGQITENTPQKDFDIKNLERKQELAQLALIGNYKVSEEAATESLLSFLVGKDSENGRATSISDYKLEKIDTATVTCSENTKNVNRSSSVEEYDDVNFYLYQINNSATETSGYAVLSNDRRIGEIIFIGDDTEFSKDISDNPFMQLFCVGLENYLENTAQIWNSLTDDDLNKAAERASITFEDTVKEGGWTYDQWKRNKGNIKNELKTKWNQNDDPYNNCIISVIGGNAHYAGCGAVAIAQIMAFHEWPKNYVSPNYNRIKNGWYYARNWNGNYDWKLLKSIEKPNPYNGYPSELQIQIGALLFDIAEGCKSSYNSDGTETDPNNCMNFLGLSGYRYDSAADYSYTKIVSSINNGCPVIVYGFSKKEVQTVPYKFLWWTGTKEAYKNVNGHCFVIDGYYNMTCIAKKGTDSITFTKDFVHCNPGWGGNKNGYYLSNVFDMRNGHLIGDDAYIDSHLARLQDIDLGENNYGFGVKQIANIQRR